MSLKINPLHIQEAERFLISGSSFDCERLAFINCLDTCDLLAVPGSGKTTALLAKLYCLSKQMPFENGRGILVLAHTNAAVNEIKRKLKPHCPNLFEYPNFVGTVQSFVNKFLASPGCLLKYSSYLKIIDDEFASKHILRQYASLPTINALSKYFFWPLFSKHSILSERILIEKYGVESEKEASIYLKELKNVGVLTANGLDYNQVKTKALREKLVISEKSKEIIARHLATTLSTINLEIKSRLISSKIDLVKSKFIVDNKSLGFSTDSGLQLLKFFESNFQKGMARYSDAYALGKWYLSQRSSVPPILQQRFSFVFIDEMQDLESGQIDVIDEVFFQKPFKSIIQRIGDKNQAIYQSSRKVKIECDWKTREESNSACKNYYLNGSNRLTETIAGLVNFFTLDDQEERFEVKGKSVLPNGDIPPKLIVFRDDTKEKLFKEFESLIIQKQSENKIPSDGKQSFRVIGWNAEWPENGDEKKEKGKLRLKDIFPYAKKSQTSREHYNTMCEYLHYFDKSEKTLKSAQRAILEILLHIWNTQEKKYFSRDQMIEAIKKVEEDTAPLKVYNEFRQKLYQWSFDLAVKGRTKEVYDAIVAFIKTEFLMWFGFKLNADTQDFIGKYESIEKAQETATDDNPLGIEVATVHSVKGQTHCAVMYVETAYRLPVYETQKLKPKPDAPNLESYPLLMQKHNCSGTFDKQALKMMYVGFSRPTHFLCFAALEENVKDDLEKFRAAGWEVDLDLAV